MKPGFDPNKLQAELSPEQYSVCVLGQTEAPHSGEYDDFEKTGEYACVVCKTPLFESGTKYHSGSGWPSFWQPKNEDSLDLLPDDSHNMQRTEVKCHTCGAHLGHVFEDGPPPTGQRFCINSLALEFSPQEEGTDETN